jgi:hypothetical protein
MAHWCGDSETAMATTHACYMYWAAPMDTHQARKNKARHRKEKRRIKVRE